MEYVIMFGGIIIAIILCCINYDENKNWDAFDK